MNVMRKNADWKARRKAQGKPMLFDAGFDPSQERDENGRWSDTGKVDRPALIAKRKALMEEMRPLAAKGTMVGSEAKRFMELGRQMGEVMFDLVTTKEFTGEKIKSEAERMSTLPKDIVMTAHKDTFANRDVFMALNNAAFGTENSAQTDVDRMYLSNPDKIYNTFKATRAALRSKFGDTMKLYRSEGKQMDKPTKNWATTREYAAQFGSNIIERDVPIDEILAVNVDPVGNYHEVIVAKRLITKDAGFDESQPRDEHGRWTAGLGYREDQRKDSTFERMREEAFKYDEKGLRGDNTGQLGYRVPITIPVSLVANVPGRSDEKRVPGDWQYDTLLEDVNKRGFTDETPIMVFVNPKGEPYINEGNTRVAIAKLKGVERISAWIDWKNGAHQVDGPWNPDKIVPLARKKITADASTADPSGTGPLQKQFKKDMRRRWQDVRKAIKDGLATYDFTGVGDRVVPFQNWIDQVMASRVLGTGAWMKGYITKAAWLAEKRAESLVQVADYDPSQPRDYKGRWTETGSIIAYHGTASSLRKQIEKEGLVVKKDERNWDEEYFKGERGESIYIASSLKRAGEFASEAANIRMVAPVVLEIEIPDGETDKVERDEMASVGGYKFPNKIPPEWIKAYHVMKNPRQTSRLTNLAKIDSVEWKRIKIRDASGTTTFYVVIPVDQQDVSDAAPVDYMKTLQDHAVAELQGIMEAVSQQAARALANGILARKNPTNDILSLITKIGEARSNMLIAHSIMKTFSVATLETFRAQGVAQVGIIPEKVPHVHIGDAARKTVQPRGKGGKFKAYTKPLSRANKRKAEKQYLTLRELGTVNVMTAEDDRVCDTCESIADNGPYGIDRALSLIPVHVNCILPGAHIDADVLVGLKSFYSGPAVEIVTVSGKRLSLTVNHPVLTKQAAVFAGQLRKGMKLITDGSYIHRASTGVQNNKHNDEAFIDKIFETLSLGGTMVLTPSTQDLHGDAVSVKGNIDVVASDSRLLSYIDVPISKHIGNGLFSDADVSDVTLARYGSSGNFVTRTNPTTSSAPRGTTLTFKELPVFLDGLPFQKLRVGLGTRFDVMRPENAVDDTSVYAKFVGKIINRHAVGVEGNNFVGGHSVALEPETNIDTCCAKLAKDGVDGDACLPSNSGSRGSAIVELDEVLEVRHFHYVGHVYDLQTTTGWFIANGIGIFNCRCVFIPTGRLPMEDYDPDQPRAPKGTETGGQWVSSIEAEGAGEAGGGITENPKYHQPDQRVFEVGGDHWNKTKATQLELEYVAAKPALLKIEENAVGNSVTMKGDTGEWETLGEGLQTSTEEKWKTNTYQEVYDSEVTNWHDNGGSARDAAFKVAQDLDDDAENEWLDQAIRDTYLINDEGQEESPYPFKTGEIMAALKVEINDNGSATFDFDNDVLDDFGKRFMDPDQLSLPGMDLGYPSDRLTGAMRRELITSISEKFDERIQEVAQDMEPPEWLADSANETLDMLWSDMSDQDKYAYYKDYLGGDEEAVADFEIDEIPTTYNPTQEPGKGDYEATQKMARYMSLERGRELINERLGEDIDMQEAYDIDTSLWKAWVDSSTSNLGIVIQSAIADEFEARFRDDHFREKIGLKGDETPQDYAQRIARQHFGDNGYAKVRAMLRAKWETTQFMLDKADMPTVNLYRGVNLKQDQIDATKQEQVTLTGTYSGAMDYTKLPEVHVQRNGAASTTHDISVANNWKSLQDAKVTLRAIVPRTAIISVPAYGVNIHKERESVVMGTAWVGWDAWLGRAPTIEEYPLKENNPQ